MTTKPTDPPPVLGGQGRTSADLERDAGGWLGVLAFALSALVVVGLAMLFVRLLG